MGLISQNSTVYLTIVEGQLAQRMKSKTNNSTTRTLSNGNVVEEEYYRGISGMLFNLDVKTHPEYGETLHVYITDDKDYCIQMQLNSSYAQNFLKTLPNVDINKPIVFTPSIKVKDDGKKDYTVFLRQDDKPVKRFYTKDGDNKLPEPVIKKGRRGAADEYDFSPVVDFLHDNVYVPIAKLLSKKNNPLPGGGDKPKGNGENGENDLSF